MVPHLCLQGGGLSPSWVRRPGQLLLFLLALLLVARFPRLGDTKRTHASANYSNVLEDSSARNLSQSTQLAFVEAGEPKSKVRSVTLLKRLWTALKGVSFLAPGYLACMWTYCRAIPGDYISPASSLLLSNLPPPCLFSGCGPQRYSGRCQCCRFTAVG